MTKKQVEIAYEEFARVLSLRFDKENMLLYGEMDGYNVIIRQTNSAYPMTMNLTVGAASTLKISAKAISQMGKDKKLRPANVKVENNQITVFFPNQNIRKEKVVEKYKEFFKELLSMIKYADCLPSCTNCGDTESSKDGYLVGSTKTAILCPTCAENIQARFVAEEASNDGKSENVVAGIVGAFLGSLVGVLAIIIISRLGYISVFSGIIMGICSLKGYELLAKKMSKKGVIISIIIMVAMTYFADRFDWAILVYNELKGEGWTLTECYQYIPEMLAEDWIDISSYRANLVMLYFATFLGAIPTAFGYLKEAKYKNKMIKICSFANASKANDGYEDPFAGI